MELKTKSKRPGMKCSVDVFYDRTDGFSEHINDRTTYKIVLVKSGSFVAEENGEYRVITAPVAMALNERAEFKVVSESNVKSVTIYFKPTFLREEFTFEAINSGKYEKFLSAVKDGDKMSPLDLFSAAVNDDIEFDPEFTDLSVCQDILLLEDFYRYPGNIVYYSLTPQEYDTVNRLFASVRYDLIEQPDNLWILRVKHFINSILFLPADFFINFRQYELYKDPLVADVARYLWENLDKDITLPVILKEFSVNKNILNDAFNKEVSMSCMSYLEQLRVDRAKKLLQFSDCSISEISSICGYKETAYFSKVFKKHTGMTASDYQKSIRNR